MTAHAHQWVRGECLRCHTDRCTDRNAVEFRCVLATPHTEPHRYADGTTAAR